jgi:hypothetical protein
MAVPGEVAIPVPLVSPIPDNSLQGPTLAARERVIWHYPCHVMASSEEVP